MDRTIFLNSSGGIIAPYASRTLVPALNIAPYIETVTFPVVSVDSSAIFGANPERLATVTISSGAALTFFVDSVAGGDDPSGNGSYDHPWRSLKTASNFLHCAQCTLNTAVKYIQIKVRGTVDYGSAWDPLPSRGCTLILAGWGERCDVGDATYYADYALNLKGRAPGDTCSGCVISNYSDVGRAYHAIDCELSSAMIGGAAYNCSGGELIRTQRRPNVVYGGSYTGTVDATYVYSTHISGAAALLVSSAAVSAEVAAIRPASGSNGILSCNVVAMSAGYHAYLADCKVSAIAVASGGRQGYAYAEALGVCFPIISGGAWYAKAYASAAADGDYHARAVTRALGLYSGATAYSAAVATEATASAQCRNASGNVQRSAVEIETTGNLGTSCTVSRIYYYVGNVVTSTSITSSGSCP